VRAEADELALRLRLAEDALVDVEADRDLVYRQCGPGRQRLTVRESNLGLRRQVHFFVACG
jgi:hypothetical protein